MADHPCRMGAAEEFGNKEMSFGNGKKKKMFLGMVFCMLFVVTMGFVTWNGRRWRMGDSPPYVRGSIAKKSMRVRAVGNDSDDVKSKNASEWGTRYLGKNDDVFKFNGWDNVEMDEGEKLHAKKKIDGDIDMLIAKPEAERQKQYEEAEKTSMRSWDKFYQQHEEGFFKDRKWILKDFPEVDPNHSTWQHTLKDTTHNVLELGCGVGNTIIPIAQGVDDPNLRIFGCDISPTAVQYAKERVDRMQDGRISFFVHDASSADDLSFPFEPGEIDVILLIFVLSAMGESEIENVLEKCYKLLRVGGMVVVRDYSEGDLAQLRFKPEKCIAPGLYVRGDGTRANFLRREHLCALIEKQGFTQLQSKEIRMLRTNRKEKLLMHRFMLQTKHVKV